MQSGQPPHQHPVEDSSKKIGKRMSFVAWICGLALLTYYFDGFLTDKQEQRFQPNSYTNEQGNHVVLKQDRSGHYYSKGYINNEPVFFILDTGATDVSIPEAVAQRLNLPYGPEQQAMTANGITTVYKTRIDVLDIGSIRLRNLSGSITPNMPGERILLGMSALKRLEFTQRGKTLTLKQ